METTGIKEYQLDFRVKRFFVILTLTCLAVLVGNQYISLLEHIVTPLLFVYAISTALLIGTRLPIWNKKTDIDRVVAEKEKAFFQAYKEYYEKTSVYHGSYPSWKALQEFRCLISSFKTDISEFNEYHFAALDAYLKRLHEEAERVRKDVEGVSMVQLSTESSRKAATGEEFLEEIISMRPALKTLLSEDWSVTGCVPPKTMVVTDRT